MKYDDPTCSTFNGAINQIAYDAYGEGYQHRKRWGGKRRNPEGSNCPDCEVKIDGLWRTGVCDECKHILRKGQIDENCENCLGTGRPVCCRCEGTGVDPYADDPRASGTRRNPYALEDAETGGNPNDDEDELVDCPDCLDHMSPEALEEHGAYCPANDDNDDYNDYEENPGPRCWWAERGKMNGKRWKRCMGPATGDGYCRMHAGTFPSQQEEQGLREAREMFRNLKREKQQVRAMRGKQFTSWV